MTPIKKSLADYPCYRITEDDSNYFGIVVDTVGDGVPWITVIEIFEEGGKTPPNSHSAAQEMFFVLKGEGKARCDGHETTLKAGDVLVLPAGSVHEVENTGKGKMYCLTTMIPNQDFAELIRHGIPTRFDAEDLAVLEGR
ncbi:cupin domain-containing protein [Telmatospirillum sp. J64-1]|uniref:cupin domain-containing protein n=1 Tax=Telmatospirillum sp. J64-1 TaxID=2502183 RepID=UPI00115F5630|nr:cupin domain-containing protein [Telmatospirillum sp. J64-1]